jgi:hypothetical protein
MIFQNSTMMHEIWISIENCQTVTIFCVDHSLPAPKIQNCYIRLTIEHKYHNPSLGLMTKVVARKEGLDNIKKSQTTC